MNTTETLLNKYGEKKTAKLLAYMDGVLEWNEKINLTAIRDREEFLVKHIADSLSSFDLPEFQAAPSVVDVGTGGGFPGIPLAIAAPDKEFLLIDSTRKKLRVIDDLCERLDINNVETLHIRAEDAARDENYSEKFDICVSRAVADLKILVAWCLPLVKRGGVMIAYKGSKAEAELEEAEAAIAKCGGVLSRIETTPLVSAGADEHKLILITKP